MKKIIFDKTDKKKLQTFFIKHNREIYLFFQLIPYCFIWCLRNKNESYLAHFELLLLVFCIHVLVILTIFFFLLLKKRAAEITLPSNGMYVLVFFFFCLLVFYKAYTYFCLVIFSQTLRFLWEKKIYSSSLSFVAVELDTHFKNKKIINKYFQKEANWFLVNNTQLILLIILCCFSLLFFNPVLCVVGSYPYKFWSVPVMLLAIVFSNSILYFISNIFILMCFNFSPVHLFAIVCETCARCFIIALMLLTTISLTSYDIVIPNIPFRSKLQEMVSGGYSWDNGKYRGAVMELQALYPTVEDSDVLLNCCSPGTNKLDPYLIEQFTAQKHKKRLQLLNNIWPD